MDKQSLASLAEKKLDASNGNIADFRSTHLHQFKSKGFETKDHELYRYTNLNAFFGQLEYSPVDKNEIDISQYNDAHFPTIFFIDGKLVSKDLQVEGIKLSPISEKFSEISSHLYSENALTDLHHSLFQEGVMVEVEKNVEVKSPVRILHLNTRSNVLAPTIFIKANHYSKLTLIEENIGFERSYAEISETYAHLQEGAKLELIQIDDGATSSLHHGSTLIEVEKDARFKNLVFHLSGKLNRRNMEAKLKSTGARAESFNLFLTHATEQSDINTVIHHLSPDTTSEQIAKGILDGDSKGVFTGKIHIHPNALRVTSSQLNKNLLLSKKAQVFSRPQLEIFADDVKCSHGSTTGQLSDDEIFYFEARGIPKEKARTLLAYGFGLEIVLKIENEIARTHVERLVMNTLKSKFQLGGK